MFRALLSCDIGFPSCLVNRLVRQIYNATIYFCMDPGSPSVLAMAEVLSPLTALSEAQRIQELERFTINRPALEECITYASLFLVCAGEPLHPKLGSASPATSKVASRLVFGRGRT